VLGRRGDKLEEVVLVSVHTSSKKPGEKLPTQVLHHNCGNVPMLWAATMNGYCGSTDNPSLWGAWALQKVLAVVGQNSKQVDKYVSECVFPDSSNLFVRLMWRVGPCV
jgi:hypothetical protein